MGLRQKIETATSAVIALCALAITFSIVRNQFFPGVAHSAGLQPTREKEWKQYARSDMRIGPASAPVTITEFSDFQCPVCSRLYRELLSVRRKRGDEIAIVYRNYPLEDLHPFARPAAIAAQCAAKQGRFPAYHDFLFEHQDSLPTIKWTELAGRLGIADTVSFATCLRAPETVTQLKRDSTDAVALGIPGTPLLLVNEWVYRGAPSVEALDSVVARVAANARR